MKDSAPEDFNGVLGTWRGFGGTGEVVGGPGLRQMIRKNDVAVYCLLRKFSVLLLLFSLFFLVSFINFTTCTHISIFHTVFPPNR